MPVATTLAVAAGAAALGAGASIISGNKAAKAQTRAADQSIAEQRRQYDTTRADFAPWRTAGAGALGMLSRAYGLEGQAPDNSEFFASPGYDFRRTEGLRAIDRSNAARGLLNSGGADKARMRYGEGLAASEYDSWWNRLSGLAGVGMNATGATSTAGMNASNNISQNLVNSGNARASSYANTGSAINSGINNVLFAYLNQGKGG